MDVGGGHLESGEGASLLVRRFASNPQPSPRLTSSTLVPSWSACARTTTRLSSDASSAFDVSASVSSASGSIARRSRTLGVVCRIVCEVVVVVGQPKRSPSSVLSTTPLAPRPRQDGPSTSPTVNTITRPTRRSSTPWRRTGSWSARSAVPDESELIQARPPAAAKAALSEDGRARQVRGHGNTRSVQLARSLVFSVSRSPVLQLRRSACPRTTSTSSPPAIGVYMRACGSARRLAFLLCCPIFPPFEASALLWVRPRAELSCAGLR